MVAGILNSNESELKKELHMRRRLKPRPNFAPLQPWCVITGPGRQNKMVTLCVFCDLLQDFNDLKWRLMHLF